ncbi:MAG: Cof-type HAD-IIB family hydrolase [Anaerolineae bacterium]
MLIRLLALDLDGTILVDLHTITPRVQATIRAAVAQGVQVAIATGRVYDVTHKFVELLGLTTPTICSQGAMIYNGHTGQIIHHVDMPIPLAEKVIDLARTHRLALNLNVNGHFYTEYLSPLTQQILVGSGATVLEVADLKEIMAIPPLKGVIVHPAADLDAAFTTLQNGLGAELSVVRSSEVLIEVFPSGVSKGHALAVLARHLNIPQSEVMAIGDHDNDVEMLAWGWRWATPAQRPKPPPISSPHPLARMEQPGRLRNSFYRVAKLQGNKVAE